MWLIAYGKNVPRENKLEKHSTCLRCIMKKHSQGEYVVRGVLFLLTFHPVYNSVSRHLFQKEIKVITSVQSKV